MTRATELIKLIESLPDAENHIYFDDGMWRVTNEWLCGSFAGNSCEGVTKEKAAEEMCKYLDAHIGHASFVGSDVTASGWPNLRLVKYYCSRK